MRINHRKTDEPPVTDSASQPRKIRLPGFLVEHEVGLGEVIKKATYAVGITPCAGCARRAAAMDRWILFSPRSR